MIFSIFLHVDFWLLKKKIVLQVTKIWLGRHVHFATILDMFGFKGVDLSPVGFNKFFMETVTSNIPGKLQKTNKEYNEEHKIPAFQDLFPRNVPSSFIEW